MDFDKWQDKSKIMFDVVDDPTYLLCKDFECAVYKKVINKFTTGKINKTDFTVLTGLMDFYWSNQFSSFVFESFDHFINDIDLKISKPNLSRALKSLETNGFIEKTGYQREIIYKFKTAFETLEELS